ELDPANLSPKQTAALQEVFANLQTATDQPTTVTATRAANVAEELRIAAVRRICGQNAELAATAIAAGWSERETEGHVIRASRPAAPAMGFNASVDEGKAIEAALAISSGVPAQRLVASYGERTVELAERRYRGINLHGVVRETLRAVGRPAGPGRIGQSQIADAFQADRQLRASFSSTTLSGIVGNVASKILLDAFTNVAGVWRSIAKVESNPDFKPSKRYRFTARGKLEEVAPDGKLKHVWLSEAEHDSELQTYGAIVQLTRKDIVNDDLMAFAQLPQQFGRMAGIKLEKSLFELLLSNPSSFFSTGNANYAEGSGTALSITSLSQAETLFMNQVDANGDPILVRPKTLLVPSTLAGTARVLCNSTQVVTGASSTLPANNPHSGNFEPISTPWLENTSITGYSTAAWYLFADPSQLAACEVAFLNGAESPIIEEGQPDFDQLGMTWRVVYDFGVSMRETAGACKMKGSA
ncbi:MAG: Mu-like prophage major head subunit gpT family protein, partial [Planctomycetaceae bacterium]|nr:Mu-like prophage major head subunit gpT family protein [Planctomycetaceae bacterium]